MGSGPQIALKEFLSFFRIEGLRVSYLPFRAFVLTGSWVVGLCGLYGHSETIPKGSYVVPFWGSILESPITNPKRNYIGAFGYNVPPENATLPRNTDDRGERSGRCDDILLSHRSRLMAYVSHRDWSLEFWALEFGV